MIKQTTTGSEASSLAAALTRESLRDSNETTLLLRLHEIHEALQRSKALYAEQDQLVMELQSRGVREITLPSGTIARIVDNFIDPKTGEPRCTVFRPAGVKRFEAQFETPEQQLKKASRK